MSENENEDVAFKMETMNKKLSSMHKIMKNILDKLEGKICGTNEAVEQKSHGKPRGTTFEEKQASFLEMLNNKRIKEPKPETVNSYKIKFDKDKNMYCVM